MKKLKNLFVLLLALMLIIPMGVVRAEEEKNDKKDNQEEQLPNNKPVKVYLFHGNGCPHCEETLEWFNSIEEEYGKYFDLVKYEVWYDEENQALMQEVGEKMGDEVGGVPYMVIGKDTYPNGFSPETEIEEGKTMADDLIEKIMNEYKKDEDDRYDVIEDINNKPNYDNVVAVVSVLVIAGIVALTVVTRKNNM